MAAGATAMAAAAISVPQKTLIVSLLGISSRCTVLFRRGKTYRREPASSNGALAGGHPFHQAIELRPHITDGRLREIVRVRPVHELTRLHVVVERGASDCQCHTDDKSEDKSHCPYSLLAVFTNSSAAAATTRRRKPLTRKKFSPAQSYATARGGKMSDPTRLDPAMRWKYENKERFKAPDRPVRGLAWR